MTLLSRRPDHTPGRSDRSPRRAGRALRRPELPAGLAIGLVALFILSAVPARGFDVIGTTPSRYALGVSKDIFTISAVFDTTPALLPDPTAIRVAGSMSGIHTGSFSISLDTLLYYNLSAPFFPGEIVNVNYRSDITSVAGDSLTGGFTFSFTIASGVGTAQWGQRRGYKAADVPYFIYGGDLNEDGRPDLAVPNEGTDNVSTFLNNTGSGYFPTHTDYGAGDTPSSIFGEDFDNDGDQDLATADIVSGTVSVLRNNGNGTFAPRDVYASGTTCRQIHGGDFDGDNDIDLCSTSFGTDKVFLFYNLGNGLFAPGVQYGAVQNGPFAIRTGDFDGDGHLDIGVACQLADSLTVMRNDGLGGFTTSGVYNINDVPWCLNGNDFDGDGDFDLVSVASAANRIIFLYNDGAGGFPTKLGRPTGAFPLGVYCADLDGDGDVDATSSNFSGRTVGIYHNDGAGDFAIDTTLAVRLSGSYTWASDLDGDGDLDLSVVDENADSLFIFPNGSSPTAVEPWGGEAGGEAGAAAPVAERALRVSPNPSLASAGVTIRVRGLTGRVTVDVVAPDGRRVRRLSETELTGAETSLQWDGRDERGRAVAPGRYFAVARGGDDLLSREILIVR